MNYRAFQILVLGLLLFPLGQRLWASQVQFSVLGPFPEGCSRALKQMLDGPVVVEDPLRPAIIRVAPVSSMAFRGIHGVVLSPVHFFQRFAPQFPSDPYFQKAVEALYETEKRPSVLTCYLAENCKFARLIYPETVSTSEEVQGDAFHSILGGGIEIRAVAPSAEPLMSQYKKAVPHAPQYQAITVSTPLADRDYLLVDWYARWLHEASHLSTLDLLYTWSRAVAYLAGRNKLTVDLALPYYQVSQGKGAVDSAFYYLLSEGIAHQVDHIVQTTLQSDPSYVPESELTQAGIYRELEMFRPQPHEDLGLYSPHHVFQRAREFYDSMEATVARARVYGFSP